MRALDLSSSVALLRQVLGDLHFWLAVAVGPVIWAVLWFIMGSPPASGMALNLFLTSVVLYPIIEELAFRGFIQTWLLEKPIWTRPVVLKISRANVLTSFIFAAFHLFNQSPFWAALVFAPSLVFGYLRERYDAVTPSIVIHAWYNFGFLWLFS